MSIDPNLLCVHLHSYSFTMETLIQRRLVFFVLIVIASCTTGLELNVHSLACIRNNAGHGLHAVTYSKFVGFRIPYYTNSNATFQGELLLAGDVHPNPGPHLTHVPTHAFVNLSSHTAERISYETSYLLKCDLGPWKTSCQSLHLDVLNRIYALGISRTPGLRKYKVKAHRGKRGGRRKQRHHLSTCGVNHGNLIYINTTNGPKSSAADTTVCLWNAHSVRNKSHLLHDYISEYEVDIMCITETWLRSDDDVIIGECTPLGYSALSIPRPGGSHGGGLAIIFRSHLGLSLRTCNNLCLATFELGHVIDNSGTVHFLIVYRPPPSPANGLRGSDFLREFEILVNEASLISGHMLGDFNMHVDCPSKSDVAQFLSIIDSAGLVQHVMGPTHSLGHTLDLIITRNEKKTLMSYLMSLSVCLLLNVAFMILPYMQIFCLIIIASGFILTCPHL